MEMPGGLMPRRRSLALDEAAAAEARRAAGIEEGGETPPIEVEGDSDEEKNKKQAEGIGSKLAAKFASKDTTASKRGKKKEEVGPSGQTYTPLEKQFMEIKAANPDVLLMMEGESTFARLHSS
jgi:DNA mismatch repair protein MSH3